MLIECRAKMHIYGSTKEKHPVLQGMHSATHTWFLEKASILVNGDWLAKEVCLSEAPTPMQSLTTSDKRGLKLFCGQCKSHQIAMMQYLSRR